MSVVWERLVQITKKYLKSATGDGLLSDVELRTLLAEVESIVNNRPITAISDDPDDYSISADTQPFPLAESYSASTRSICE